VLSVDWFIGMARALGNLSAIASRPSSRRLEAISTAAKATQVLAAGSSWTSPRLGGECPKI